MVSSVKILIKQGVSKGAGTGFEAEVFMEMGETEEVMKELIDKTLRCSQYLMKQPLVETRPE
jgi:hypothetical protein